MAVEIDESKCTGCEMCAEVCPVEAITIDQVPKIDAATCIDCGSCVDECPNGAISMEGMETTSSARSPYSPPPSPIPAMQDESLPNPPSWTSNGQRGFKHVNKGGLLRQIFNFFGKSTGQGRGQGRGRGNRHGR